MYIPFFFIPIWR